MFMLKDTQDDKSIIMKCLFVFLQKVKKSHISEPVRGAIIESMQHHGQGVYSGTFSGECWTLSAGDSG